MYPWIYATGAVSVVSLIGLFCVLFIPLLKDRRSGQHGSGRFMHLLVGLAIGTLSGDALLHLLPHAFDHSKTLIPIDDDHFVATNHSANDTDHHALHDEHDDDGHGHHSEGIFIGLMALAGMMSFLAFEKLFQYYHRCQYQEPKRRVSMVHHELSVQCSKTSTSSGIASTDDEDEVDDVDNDDIDEKPLEKMTPNGKANGDVVLCNGNHVDICKIVIDPPPDLTNDIRQPLTALDQVKKGNGELVNGCQNGHLLNGHHHHHHPVHQLDHHHHPHSDHHHGHQAHHFGHGHHHHHIANKSTIYSIVTGDGLHNFCDGIAIGVAFDTGFYGGLATSIAILMHELPHEIGDFAVLLKAGLSVRNAVKYNILSSVLAFVGMALGLYIGELGGGALSAYIAGTFLHISLVDMMPQLSSLEPGGADVDERPRDLGDDTAQIVQSHKKGRRRSRVARRAANRAAGGILLLQVTGIAAGIVIMYLVASFE